MTTIFIISAIIVAYTYLLYPLLLIILSKNRKSKNSIETKSKLHFTIIIPAYNEIAVIQKKIDNTIQIAQNHIVQIIVNSSGSNDGTEKMSFENILHITSPHRKGKAHAMNEAVALATGDIIIFTDANTFLSNNLLDELSSSFANEKVGVVTGKKMIDTSGNVNSGENSYWVFENSLKKFESDFFSVTAAAGEMLAIRKAIYKSIPENIILDDFYISIETIKQGYLIRMNENISSVETASGSLADEYTRRTRIASGALQWIHHCIFKKPLSYRLKYMWQFFSNKITRWILTPLALLVMLILGSISTIAIIQWFTIAVVLMIAIGALCNYVKRYPKIFHVPFYFFFIHICIAVGYWQYIIGKATVLWAKAKRI